MKRMITPIKNAKRGQSIVEYLIVAAAIIGVIAIVAPLLANQANTVMTTAINQIGR